LQSTASLRSEEPGRRAARRYREPWHPPWAGPLVANDPITRRKAKGIVSKWHVAVRGGVPERVKAGDSNSLVSPQKFALDLVINDCWHQNAGAREKTIFEPVRYRDYFMTALWLRYQAEGTRIRGKERRSRVDERFT
jgi:hypothetical protein